MTSMYGDLKYHQDTIRRKKTRSGNPEPCTHAVAGLGLNGGFRIKVKGTNLLWGERISILQQPAASHLAEGAAGGGSRFGLQDSKLQT